MLATNVTTSCSSLRSRSVSCARANEGRHPPRSRALPGLIRWPSIARTRNEAFPRAFGSARSCCTISPRRTRVAQRLRPPAASITDLTESGGPRAVSDNVNHHHAADPMLAEALPAARAPAGLTCPDGSTSRRAPRAVAPPQRLFVAAIGCRIPKPCQPRPRSRGVFSQTTLSEPTRGRGAPNF